MCRDRDLEGESAGQPGKCSGLQDEVSTGAPSSVRSKPASTEKNTEGHSQWRARRLLLVSLWYVVSFLGILLNKELLSPGASGERITVTVLALVQMLSTVFTGVFFQTVGRSAIRRVGSASEVNDLLLLGLLRVLVTVLGLVSLSFVAASFTETIKASSPFFTVAAAWLLTGERTPLPAVVTLVPILLGLVLATTGELSFTLVGFAAALAVNVTECVQNVFCSWLLQKGSFKSNELQFYSALAALVVLLPAAAWQAWAGEAVLPCQAAFVWWRLPCAGLVFVLQSALVFKLMSLYSPVTVSVLNTVKRALIICCSALYFRNVITLTTLCGTVVTLLGSGLYGILKSTHVSSEVYAASNSMAPEAIAPKTTPTPPVKPSPPVAPAAMPQERRRCWLRRRSGRRGRHSCGSLFVSALLAFQFLTALQKERPVLQHNPRTVLRAAHGFCRPSTEWCPTYREAHMASRSDHVKATSSWRDRFGEASKRRIAYGELCV